MIISKKEKRALRLNVAKEQNFHRNKLKKKYLSPVDSHEYFLLAALQGCQPWHTTG